MTKADRFAEIALFSLPIFFFADRKPHGNADFAGYCRKIIKGLPENLAKSKVNIKEVGKE